MNTTSLELQKREKGIKSFDKYWYIDLKTLEIKRKPLNILFKLIGFFWEKKHKVCDFYWWAVRNWDSNELIVFNDAIKHDDIPINGIPRKYKMLNGWSIPPEDLRYLYEGPLVGEDDKIIVKYQSKLQKLVSIISQLKPISWLIPCAFTIINYFSA